MILYQGFVTVEKVNGMEVVRSTNSVAFLIVDKFCKIALLISQDRPAMVNQYNPLGTITEVPAGRFDLRIGVKGLVVKEAKEEVGIDVREEQVILLNDGLPLALSPGILSEKTYLAYIETDLAKCMSDISQIFGNPDEGEQIKRIVVGFDELSKMHFDDLKTFALVQWFLCERKE